MMYLHNVPPPSRLDLGKFLEHPTNPTVSPFTNVYSHLDYPGSISEVETGEWAEFQHRPGHKYTNFDEVGDITYLYVHKGDWLIDFLIC